MTESNGIPELMLLLLIFASAIFSVLWIFIFPVVGMLYMLGYLT